MSRDLAMFTSLLGLVRRRALPFSFLCCFCNEGGGPNPGVPDALLLIQDDLGLDVLRCRSADLVVDSMVFSMTRDGGSEDIVANATSLSSRVRPRLVMVPRAALISEFI
jgi:hypothetical protein